MAKRNSKSQGRPQKNLEAYQKVAQLLAEGVPMRKAFQSAGWSAGQARKGKKLLSRPVMQALASNPNFKALVHLGEQLTAEDQENLVRGRLAQNVVRGEDRGVASAHLLGKDRRINLFVQDSQTGIIVITPPADAMPSEIMHKGNIPAQPPARPSREPRPEPQKSDAVISPPLKPT